MFLRRITRRLTYGPQADCVCGLAACLPTHLCPAAQAGSWAVSPAPGIPHLAPYQGSSWETIDIMLKLAKFKSGDKVLDLGAGDGRVLIRAMQLGAVGAVGWEINPDVFELAKAHIAAALNSEQQSRCSVYLGDASACVLDDSDIVCLYLLPAGLAEISQKLKQNSQSSLKRPRVVSTGWAIPGWTVSNSVVSSGGSTIFLHE